MKMSSFVIWTQTALLFIETDDIYKDIAEDIEKGFDAFHYQRDALLPKWKNEKVIVLVKDE